MITSQADLAAERFRTGFRKRKPKVGKVDLAEPGVGRGPTARRERCNGNGRKPAKIVAEGVEVAKDSSVLFQEAESGQRGPSGAWKRAVGDQGGPRSGTASQAPSRPGVRLEEQEFFFLGHACDLIACSGFYRAL